MISLLMSAQAAGGGTGAFIAQILPLVLIFIVFYWFLIRPQQKRAKEHAAKVEATQRGDEVVTGGGLMGKVTKIADDHVEIEIAQGVRVRAVKSTISDVVPKGVKRGKQAND